MLGNPPLSVSLVALDKTDYAFGDALFYTLRMENTGKFSTRIPTSISLADFEPEDAKDSYRYEPMEVWLRLVDRQNRQLKVGLLVLYGSRDKPGTQMELRPGEWVEVRGKALLLPIPDRDNSYLDVTPSDMPAPFEKKIDVTASVAYWKGDLVEFNAKSQLESYSCGENEIETGMTPYRGRIGLVPAAKK